MPSARLAGHHRRSQWPTASAAQRVHRSRHDVDTGELDAGRVRVGACPEPRRPPRQKPAATCPDSPRTRQSQSARDKSVKVIWVAASPGGSSTVQDSTAPLTSSTATSGVAASARAGPGAPKTGIGNQSHPATCNSSIALIRCRWSRLTDLATPSSRDRTSSTSSQGSCQTSRPCSRAHSRLR